MTNVWILQGSTGEYEDHRTWMVAAFTSHQAAFGRATRANNWLRQHGLHEDLCTVAPYTERREAAKANPFDPHCHVDYTGAKYFVTRVPLDPS